jgi:anti-anti-sigma regulatory factor
MVLSLPPRLTVENRALFRRRIMGLIDGAVVAGVTTITLDLADTTELDATAIALLTVMRERAALHGVVIELRGPAEPVRHMLILAGLM